MFYYEILGRIAQLIRSCVEWLTAKVLIFFSWFIKNTLILCQGCSGFSILLSCSISVWNIASIEYNIKSKILSPNNGDIESSNHSKNRILYNVIYLDNMKGFKEFLLTHYPTKLHFPSSGTEVSRGEAESAHCVFVTNTPRVPRLSRICPQTQILS